MAREEPRRCENPRCNMIMSGTWKGSLCPECAHYAQKRKMYAQSEQKRNFQKELENKRKSAEAIAPFLLARMEGKL